MNKQYPSIKFGDFVEIQPIVKINKNTKYSFVPMESIIPGMKYVYPSEEKKYDGSGVKFKNDDIIFARITPCLEHGKIAIARGLKKGKGFGSTEYYIFRAKQNISDKDYVYYLSISPIIKENAIVSMVGASGRQRAQKDVIEKIIIKPPNYSTQQKISSILSNYDNLIDNNQKRIALLEEAARLLYREWFVFFRFPGHENVKFTYGLPEGWRKEKLNKYIIFKRGIEPGTENYLENKESFAQPFFRVSDLVSRNPDIFVDELYIKDALLEKKDIVVSLDGSVGIVSMGLKGSYSSGIRKLIIKGDRVNRSFLYCLMQSHYIQGVIRAYSKGTTIQHAGESIKYMQPVLPPKELMDKFGDIFEPVLDEILVLLDQNQKLAQARDLLLPRLMSGKIDVSKIDNKTLEEAKI